MILYFKQQAVMFLRLLWYLWLLLAHALPAYSRGETFQSVLQPIAVPSQPHPSKLHHSGFLLMPFSLRQQDTIKFSLRMSLMRLRLTSF